MDDSTLIVLGILLGFPIVFGLFWSAIVFLLATLAGWRRLAVAYGSDEPPRGEAFRWQTGRVGFITYRNVMNIHAAPNGLHLSMPLPFRVGHRNLFVPWKDVHDAVHTKAFFRDVTQFDVGRPRVARVEVPAEVFRSVGR